MRWLFAKIVSAVALAACASSCSTFNAFKGVGDGKVMQKGDVTCTDLVPEVAQTRVRACETPVLYDIVIGNQQYTYDKRAVRKTLREGIARLVSGSAYPVRTLNGARLELWINAPVFQPEAAEFVAVVISSGGNFALPLPIDQRLWTFDRDKIVLLGRDRYPSANAKLAGKVIVEASGGATPARFADYLARTGYLSGGQFPVSQLTVPAFSERLAARSLTASRDARLFISNVRLTAAGEKEGAKARAFVFELGQ